MLKRRLDHFSSGDIGVWNLDFLKIKLSVFENFTVIKGLNYRKASFWESYHFEILFSSTRLEFPQK